MKNCFLEEEMMLEEEIKRKNLYKNPSNQSIAIFLLILSVCFIGLLTAYNESEYDKDMGRGVWGETWECSGVDLRTM